MYLNIEHCEWRLKLFHGKITDYNFSDECKYLIR